MRFVNFGSSSSGNCYYIEMQRKEPTPPAKILLEAGISYKEVIKKAGMERVDLSGIDAILVTHEHQDHARAVKDFRQRGFKIYANERITEGDPTVTLRAGQAKVIAVDTTVTPISVEHDAPESLGFILRTAQETAFFFNDCKYFSADLSSIPVDYVMIEANYDGQTVHFAYEQAKNDSNRSEMGRYQRIVNAHMSIAHCITHLRKMDLSQCKAIFLMHLSDRNSNAERFKYRVQQATGIQNTFVCRKNGGLL